MAVTVAREGLAVSAALDENQEPSGFAVPLLLRATRRSALALLWWQQAVLHYCCDYARRYGDAATAQVPEHGKWLPA